VNELIKKLLDIVNPPGLAKPNRGALFNSIGEVFGQVKDDADTAFKAHFPYLADTKKLEQHGKALLVPHLLHDSGEEYRNRVAAASFFLMRAGERAYVISQLEAHFGGRYMLAEQFLQIYVKILDLSDEDRTWVLEFLDMTLDPNILLTVAEWFHFIDTIDITESVGILAKRSDTDVWLPKGGFCYDGRFLCDQGIETLCDGTWLCDGSRHCDWMPARGTVFDDILAEVFPNGAYRCDGSIDCSGYVKIHAPMAIPGAVLPVDTCGDKLSMRLSAESMRDQAVILPLCDGTWLCNGSNRAAMLDPPMRFRIVKPFVCNGITPSCSLCDGSIVCDGSYTGFDGRYCREDILQEAV
jgi:hypothetical protein